MESRKNNVIQSVWLDIIDEESIVDIFSQLLEAPDKKRLIISEVFKRITSLSPVTSYDEEKAKKGESLYTIVDNIIGNNHWTFSLKDVVCKDGAIYLQIVNIERWWIHSNQISERVLLDIINVIFFWEVSEIKEKIELTKEKAAIILNLFKPKTNWN